MKNSKVKNFLFVFLLVASLLFGLTLSPVSMTTADAKTKMFVTVKVGSKKVNKKTIALKEGSSKKIKLSFTPNHSGIKKMYKSSRKGIVSVSRTGKLKAKKAGTAKITVTVSGNNMRETKLWFKVKVIRQSNSDKKTGTPIVLNINGQSFQAVFYNNKTANALLEKMPMTLNMKELNGNEKYHFLIRNFLSMKNHRGRFQPGILCCMDRIVW